MDTADKEMDINEELFSAVEHIKFETARDLLDMGADPSWRHPRCATTVLHRAVTMGWIDMVNLLLEYDCSGCAIPDAAGRTPFEWSAALGHDEIFVALTRAGLVSFGHSNGLAFVVRWGTPFQVSQMIDGGHDPLSVLPFALNRGGRIADLIIREMRGRNAKPTHDDFLGCSSVTGARAALALLGRDSDAVSALARDGKMPEVVRDAARVRLAKIEGMGFSKVAGKDQGKREARRRI